MTQATMDWERCFRNLEARLPEVREELKARIVPLLKTDLRRWLDRMSAERFPPHLRLYFGDPQDIRAEDFDRNREKIAIAIGEVATKHGLRTSLGFYKEIGDTGRRVWNYDPYSFIFKPNYGDYEVREITPA